jgi:hypothetical protein
LTRLAFLYVVVHGFGPSLAAFGPKLDPSFRLGGYEIFFSNGCFFVIFVAMSS